MMRCKWLDALKQLVRNRDVFAYGHGSALKDIGVLDFLAKLDLLTETNYMDTGDFAARVYKVRHDENGNRVTFLKVLQGGLRVRDEVQYADTDRENHTN